jgi:hypothetical protein
LQSVESSISNISWEAFSALIHERFSRDQHELLIRQLFHIHQTTTVSNYVDRFTDLVEQLAAYTPNQDPIALTTSFIDGLRDDIRRVVMVARPANLDTACTHALLQEEASDQGSRQEYRTSAGSRFLKSTAIKGALPLPPPPRPVQSIQGEARHPPESHKHGGTHGQLDERFSILRSYRKARGLYIRCGEKWVPGHKCSPVPQLHALQEIWELCQDEFQESDCSDSPPESDQHQVFLLLSSVALSGAPGPRTLQLCGSIADRPISILVDSGSSHSFLSSAVAAELPGVQPLPAPVVVRVADGNTVQCSSQIPHAEWVVQGHSFHSSLRILELGHYDMIVGMDWLEAFSPMKVDWKCKWMSIPYGRHHIMLHGDLPGSRSSELLQFLHISVDSVDVPVPTLPLEVQGLVEEFSTLFEVPSELPPRRACDHTIPLLPGAPPVAVRQYCYKPAMKNEIEKQVQELLQSGMVRPSTSPYSSPVLLVYKKDDTWRMCVDYRMLNAITVKAKFPIPVIDELLDELCSAKWFSSLDLRSGFNQIRLAPGEEHKTTFQTHWGQFEYTVMSFGLTGLPTHFKAP